MMRNDEDRHVEDGSMGDVKGECNGREQGPKEAKGGTKRRAEEMGKNKVKEDVSDSCGRKKSGLR